jgi:hypothetical protein
MSNIGGHALAASCVGVEESRYEPSDRFGGMSNSRSVMKTGQYANVGAAQDYFLSTRWQYADTT